MAELVVLSEALLEELAERWRALGAPIADKLAPGLSDEQIDELVEPLALRVPPEARTWWRWHNGGRDDFIVYGGGKAFSSLESCVERATMMRRIAHEVAQPYRLSAREEEQVARGVWNWNWLPLSTDGVGAAVVIDASTDAGSRPVCPALYRDRDDGASASPLAPSIGALVGQWIAVLDSGAVRFEPRRGRWTFVREKLPAGHDDRIL